MYHGLGVRCWFCVVKSVQQGFGVHGIRLGLRLRLVSTLPAMQVTLKRSYSTTALLTPCYTLWVCAGMCVGLHLATGFVLACWYSHSAEGAFSSVVVIGCELDAVVALRGLHENCASVFFMYV